MATVRFISFVLLESIFLAHLRAQTLNILAYEYSRKFWEIPDLGLEMGQCAHYVKEVIPGFPLVNRCMLPPVSGQSKLHHFKFQNDTQNIQVQSANDIFAYIGLCDATAITTLGLLHRGDCIAIEIASSLTFNKKTYVRAYIEYYRKNVVSLEQTSLAGIPLTAGHGQEYFLKIRSIGTMEVVLVEMRFADKQKAAILRNTRYSQSLSMKDWISFANQTVGEPSNVKVIRMSTARRLMEVKKYRTGKMAEIKGLLGRYEGEIQDIRREISQDYIQPHLDYAFQPYYTRPQGLQLRSGSDRSLWEKASITEVKIIKAQARQRSILRRCKRIILPSCATMKTLKSQIKSLKATFDTERRKWVNLSETQKQQTVETTRKKINNLAQQQSKMISQFKQWRRQQKAAKRAEKLKQKKLRQKQRSQRKKSKKRKITRSKIVLLTNNTILPTVV
ncbi:uncharacterized protein LOC133202477 [Saccostrea echinata]|uniref:uncharacterized protein LOC133202477 n=1 Tax=Saccostrea echinata TaxID=191078 RepID=UPI002A833886|nr:uncharacterized protein LOC133202477 [Saccostrea echinata]